MFVLESRTHIKEDARWDVFVEKETPMEIERRN